MTVFVNPESCHADRRPHALWHPAVPKRVLALATQALLLAAMLSLPVLAQFDPSQLTPEQRRQLEALPQRGSYET